MRFRCTIFSGFLYVEKFQDGKNDVKIACKTKIYYRINIIDYF